MTYTMPYRWGPGDTPTVIGWLIGITCVLSVLTALTNYLFTQLLGYVGPHEVLGLSTYGLKHYFLWQPVTYLFIQESLQGITFSFLISLLFSMYILWILGSTLAERIGTSRFLCLYLISGALAGLAAVWMMSLAEAPQAILAGPSASLLAIFVVWTMCNPNSELMLFFIIPIRTKWLLAGIVGAICLVSLSQLDVVSLTFYVAGIAFGYFYGLIALRLPGPFAITHRFDEAVTELVDKLKPKSKNPQKKEGSSKIFDFSSGEPMQNDDAFVDAMLTKISKYGERSLSASERQRMEQISKRKMRNRTH